MDEFADALNYQADAHVFLFQREPMLSGVDYTRKVSMPAEPQKAAPQQDMGMPSEADAPEPYTPKYTEDQLELMPEWISASKKMFSAMNDGQRFIGSDKQAAAYGLDLMSEFNWNMTGPAGIPGESGISAPGFAFQVAALMSEEAGEENALTFLQMLNTYSDTAVNGASIKRAFRGIFADPLTYAGIVGKLASMPMRASAEFARGPIKEMLMKTATGVAMPYDLGVKYPGRTGMAAGAGYGMGFEGGTMGVEQAAGYGPTAGEAAQRLGTAGGIGAAAGGALGKAIGGGAPVVRQGIDVAGQAAEQRMAERGPITSRVMSGVDPMDVIDPALAAAGKLARPTKQNPITAVAPTETEPGIIAFHGSGADFDEFSVNKIGTGEGAQAYGYGLYFTDSEDIAKFYKDMMARNVDIDGRPYIRGNQINDNLVDEDIADDLAATNGDLEAAIKSSEEFLQEMIEADNVQAINSTSKELEKLKQLRGRVTVGSETGKTYKVALEPKSEELLDYDKPIGEQSEEIKIALIKALEDINDPELNANITLEARAAKEKQEAVASLNKELDDFSDSLPNQKSKETFAKLRELLIDKKHKWSAMVNRADVEEERKLFEEFTKAVPPSKYPDIDPNIIYDIQRSLKIASPKSIGSFLPTDKKTADALSNAGIKGIKYRAAVSRSADVDDATAERNYVIFDDKMIKILEKYGIVGPVAITALGAAKQEGAQDGNL